MTEHNLAVILPVYGGDNPVWLKEALQSLESQQLEDFLLIVVADGPLTSELDVVIASIKKTEFHKIRLPQNQGLAVALNHGLDFCFESNIPFIARMDADDICLPGRLKLQIDFLEKNTEVDVVGSSIIEIDENGKERGKVVKYPLIHAECRQFFRKRDPVAHPSVMFRTSFFDKAGKYDEAYRKNQDTMLWYKGFLNGCIFANIEEPLLKFRITGNFFLSRRNGWKRASQMFSDRRMINKKLGYGPDAYLYAIGMFCLTVAPAWMKRLAYRVLR